MKTSFLKKNMSIYAFIYKWNLHKSTFEKIALRPLRAPRATAGTDRCSQITRLVVENSINNSRKPGIEPRIKFWKFFQKKKKNTGQIFNILFAF